MYGRNEGTTNQNIGSMQIRRTARILLFDEARRLLLMHMHDPDVAGADGRVLTRSYWVTIGGEVEPGEELAEGARREIAEETGQSDVTLGPAVWYGEHVLVIRGEPRLLQETYFVAFTGDGKISDANWTDTERAVVKGMKWWEPEALLQSDALVFPTSLREHLPPLLEGRYPRSPLRIAP